MFELFPRKLSEVIGLARLLLKKCRLWSMRHHWSRWHYSKSKRATVEAIPRVGWQIRANCYARDMKGVFLFLVFLFVCPAFYFSIYVFQISVGLIVCRTLGVHLKCGLVMHGALIFHVSMYIYTEIAPFPKFSKTFHFFRLKNCVKWFVLLCPWYDIQFSDVTIRITILLVYWFNHRKSLVHWYISSG